MKNNILKTLTNNWAFKLLAFVAAFTLWLIVYNMEDPTKTDTMSMQVSIINRDAVAESEKYFEVMEGTGKVTFSVTAPRSVLDKLEETDFTAVADMEYLQISDDGLSGTVPIDIRCIDASYVDQVKLNTTTKTLKVRLENLMTKSFMVNAEVKGEVLKGYALGTVALNGANVLKVSGPESIVSTIDSVVATIDVEGMSANLTDSVVPVLYDAEGKEVNTTRLSLSNGTINISANILKTKDVPVMIKPSGTPANGYTLIGVSYEPEIVTLKGSPSVLNAINSIEIPSELLSVQEATANVEAIIDITEYLPYGAELVNKEDSNIEITVIVGRIHSKRFNISTSNITVTGLPVDMEYRFVHSSVGVTISALEEDLDLLKAANITASVDVKDLPEGQHELKIILDIDGTKYTYEEATVTIQIRGLENQPPSTETGGEANTEGSEEGTSSRRPWN